MTARDRGGGRSRRRHGIATCLLGLLGASPVAGWAASAGAEPFQLLLVDANARTAAMGGAYTALADDANALLYNPAGLGRVASYEAAFTHNQHFADITQDQLSLAAPRGWGLQFGRVDSGDVPRTTVSNPGGSGLGNVVMTNIVAGAGVGRAVGGSLYLGAGMKFIRESVAGVAAEGCAFDLGALYVAPAVPGLSLGWAVQNVGPAVRFQSAREELPTVMRGGAAYAFAWAGQRSRVSLEMTKGRSSSPVAALGAETVIAGALALRLGFNSRDDAGPGITAGFGLSRGAVTFDYAVAPFGDLGVTHRFSVAVRWGRAPPGSPTQASATEHSRP